ncbi:MAG: proton-conducting transporter membrane subunit [Candidatus Omnitrophica bacterium]|nr:proton-conducting transporter membrane subunit [Candidatus Omnitrophota bacterium]
MILIFFVITPIAAAFLIGLAGRYVKNFSDSAANLTTVILFAASLYTLNLVNTCHILVYKIGGWLPPAGICVVADGLAVFMLVTVNLISLLVMIYSINYMNSYTEKWKFHALYMLMLVGMNGVIISGDLFNLYVFLELASISAYALVAFGTEASSLEAAFKYAIMGSIASLFILLGIALLYSYTSTLSMFDIAAVLAGKPRAFLINFVSVLFLAGFALKAALVPFHAWLPDAHSSAPTPVSATLSGVFIKTLGIYAMLRVFFSVIGATSNLLLVLMVLGLVSMIAGAFLAIAQNDMKRMFAYSSISQVGYIIIGLGCGSLIGIAGAAFHLFNHSIFKSLLFINSAAVESQTGSRNMDKLSGLAAKMPLTAVTSVMASLSAAGLPPLAGFWSKLIIIMALWISGHYIYALIAVLASILTLAYFLLMQRKIFFSEPNQELSGIKEAGFGFSLASIILASIIAVVGVAFPFLVNSIFVPFWNFLGV